MVTLMDSILNTIKSLIGLTEDYHAFDTSIIVSINSAIAILTQLGFGDETGFRIESASDTWDEFIGGLNPSYSEMVKSYIYLRTLYTFDKTLNSSALNSIKEEFTELESRLNYAFDVKE